MKEILKNIKNEAFKAIKEARSLQQLKDIHDFYVGRKKGKLTEILKSLKNLSIKDKRVFGPFANEIKQELQKKIELKKDELTKESIDLKKEKIDFSLPGEKTNLLANLHPISQIQYEVEDLFTSMGFMILDGPELESEYYNFDSVNMPFYHPARDTQDTFWVTDKFLMRTQTSSVQIRALEEYGAPLKAIVPGRVFRAEEQDASHSHTFYQVEGLMVDKNISVANLIGAMKAILSKIFNHDVVIRLRPGYFPFVEPAFELDIQCMICKGVGCPTCKNNGWIELIPCGMIHPNVLKYGDVDPHEYSGFAFGLGLDRLVMMRYRISDIRYFLKGDIRFLKQF
jgi:phenylalanyl-tRNA synthetase alpha chain